MPRPRRLIPALLCVLLLPLSALAQDAGALERQVRELQRQVEELKARSGQADAAALAEIERKIQVLTEEIERLKLGEAAPAAGESVHGLGPAASKVYAAKQGVSIGGYGEYLYENFDGTREDGTASDRTDQFDMLRLILYAGYKFNDRVLFNSEIEFEHGTTGSGDDEKGEVSVEFAYLDFKASDAATVRAGLLLVPVGFVNELHEPPIFLGSRRPLVERAVIPTTWRELGAGAVGEAGPVSWRAYVTTSLDSTGFGASGIRGGRTSGSRTPAEDFALTGRVDWTPLQGLLLGASAFAGNTGQGRTTDPGEAIDGRVTLYDVHAEYRRRGLQARALFARSTLDDADLISAANGEVVGERQVGWYGEVGYDLLSLRDGATQALIPYVRYEAFNTHDEVPAGLAADPAQDQTVLTVGLSYKPIPQVAIKADWNRQENEARTGTDQVNVALGFLF